MGIFPMNINTYQKRINNFQEKPRGCQIRANPKSSRSSLEALPPLFVDRDRHFRSNYYYALCGIYDFFNSAVHMYRDAEFSVKF